MRAARVVGRIAAMTDEQPIGTVRKQNVVDRTGTLVGRRLAARVANEERPNWSALLRNEKSSALAETTNHVLRELRDSAVQLPTLKGLQRSPDMPFGHHDVTRLHLRADA
jgi:hypothetical protein